MKVFLRSGRSKKASQRLGSAMVEVAICFPVLLLILMGIIEFGRAMSVNQMLNSAARIGCRVAVLDGSNSSTVTSVVKQHVAGTLGCLESHVTVGITATSSRTGASLADVSAASTGDMIKIAVSVPFSAVSWSVKNHLSGSTVRGECSMQHE